MKPSFITTIVLSFAATAWAEPSATERYFEGLRQRGLYDLAEGEAIRRFGQPANDASERATLVAEFARTLSEHARYTEGDEQTDLWNRADAALAEFLKSHPDRSEYIDLEVLRGELSLARGETLRWLAELIPEQPAYRVQAQSALDAAVAKLSECEGTLSKRLRDRVRERTLRTEPLTPAELDELLTRTRLLLGRTELERARIADGQTRTDCIAAAEKALEQVSKGATADETTWQARVLLAETALLAGKHDLARLRLAALDPALLPGPAKDAIATVSARLLLDEGKPDRAVAFLIDYRRSRGTLTGELRLLQIRGLADAAAEVEKLGRPTEAAELRKQIATVVEWADAEQGGYWVHRARLAARQATRAARYGSAVVDHVRRAEAGIASGDIDAALAEYDEAILQVKGKGELEHELSAARAGLLLNSERFDQAAVAFEELASIAADPKAAAEAHLLGAYAVGRAHDADPSAERREAYRAKLEEHRNRFADSPTAAEATLRLAQLLETRRQYSRTIPLLREIVADSERGPAAAAALARNYENLLLHLAASKRQASSAAEAAAREQQLAEWSAAALDDLRPLAESLAASVPQPMSAAQAELALRSGRLMMQHADESALAGRLLDLLAVASSEEHPPAQQEFWQAIHRAALPLRVISLADRNRYDEALRIIDSLEGAPVADLLAVVQELSELSDPEGDHRRPAIFGQSDGRVGPRLTDLRRAATVLLAERRAELSPEQARQIDLVVASANLADGRAAEAIDRYEAALAERPKDKVLLIKAATALLASGETDAILRAKEYWRRVENLESSGSEGWFNARLNMIEANVVLGEIAEARKLLTVTRLLHPHLGGDDTKAAFDAIQRRLESATAGAAAGEPR